METVKHVHAIEYRNKTEPPTERGLYWAREIARPEPRKLEPVFWLRAGRIAVIGSSKVHSESQFDFFGPVAECREG